MINSEADDSDGKLVAKAQEYLGQANALLNDDKSALADCAVGREIPDWLRKEAEQNNDDAALEEARGSIENLVEAGALLGIDASSGADNSNVMRSKVTEYLEGTEIGKSLCNNLIEKIWPLGRDGCKRGLEQALSDERDEILAKLSVGDARRDWPWMASTECAVLEVATIDAKNGNCSDAAKLDIE